MGEVSGGRLSKTQAVLLRMVCLALRGTGDYTQTNLGAVS